MGTRFEIWVEKGWGIGEARGLRWLAADELAESIRILAKTWTIIFVLSVVGHIFPENVPSCYRKLTTLATRNLKINLFFTEEPEL